MSTTTRIVFEQSSLHVSYIHSTHIKHNLQYPLIVITGVGFLTEGQDYTNQNLASEPDSCTGIFLAECHIDELKVWRIPSLIHKLALKFTEHLEEHKLLPCHLAGAGIGEFVALEAAKIQARKLAYPGQLEQNIATLSLISTDIMHLISRNYQSKTINKYLTNILETKMIKKLFSNQWMQESFAHLIYNPRPALESIERPILCIVPRDENALLWHTTPRLWEINTQATMKTLTPDKNFIENTLKCIHEFCLEQEYSVEGNSKKDMSKKRI